jgi:energy-coupling factor transport system permease protein
MRSPFAYTPRPGPLQAASPGAAVAYLGALTAIAFVYSNPIVLGATGAAVVLAGCLAGARAAVRAGLWMGFVLALLIVTVNAFVVSRGETVLVRLGEWPLLSDVITVEAIASGAVLGLRAAVVMVAFAVYSACVDPDRVLRGLRPFAGRSALTATLVSRLVPVAAADAGRLRDAARLRGPGAAPVGRAPLARRLLAGSLDRAVDVAATLELRGYSLGASTARTEVALASRPAEEKRYPEGRPCLRVPDLVRVRIPGLMPPGISGRTRVRAPTPGRSRHDRRFYLVAVVLLAGAVAGKLLGADAFVEYPTLAVGAGPATLALSALIVLSGLAPWRGGRGAIAPVLHWPTYRRRMQDGPRVHA